MSAEIIDFNKFIEDSKRIKISHESLVEKEKDECEKIIDEMQAIVNKLNLMFPDSNKDKS
ncbi:MAG: hypothetical protein E7004_06995 [Alphaproteobacteria bacterium]|nr:hypothetical protein [Alphaproteobacteria bacterium]